MGTLRHPLEQTSPSPLEADTPQSRHPPGADTPPRSRHPPEQTPPWSRHPPSAQSRHAPPEADTPPPESRLRHTVNERPGRYASYWNAFLLFMILNTVKTRKHSSRMRTARSSTVYGRGVSRETPLMTETPRRRHMGPDRNPPGKNMGPQTGSDIILSYFVCGGKKGVGVVGMILHWM